jgi:hypothetical protein
MSKLRSIVNTLRGRRIVCLSVWLACGTILAGTSRSEPPATGARLEYVAKSTQRVCQLTGDEDRARHEPTLSRTLSRAGVLAADLGSSFEHNGKLFFLFGDTWGKPGDWDSVAWTDSRDPEKVALTFHIGADGKWLPPIVPGIKQAGWEIPSYGVSIDGKMYVVFTTDHSEQKTMGRSVLAVSDDDGQVFRQVYDLSADRFINVALWKVDSWLYIFGSGKYRESSVCLARVELKDVERRDALRFFSGRAADGSPQWSENERDATPLFHHDVVGELSVAYCKPVKRYVMLYNVNSFQPHGILMRSAETPWGPWSDLQVLFDSQKDAAFGKFMHAFDKKHPDADGLSEPNRDTTTGEEYGPYIISRFTTGEDGRCRIYYTMSTWNPYQVHIMRSDLRLVP